MKRYAIMIVSLLIYMILFYIYKDYLEANLFLIPKESMQWGDMINALLHLFIGGIVIPFVSFLPAWKEWRAIKRDDSGKTRIMILGLLCIYTILSLYKGITPVTVFNFIQYLVIVAIGEEMIFRGIIYNVLKGRSYKMAVIGSGAVWGIMHYAPGMWVNGIVGGIAAGWIFIFLYETGGSIAIPILVHAIWDSDTGLPIKLTIVMMVIIYYGYEKIKQNKNRKQTLQSV